MKIFVIGSIIIGAALLGVAVLFYSNPFMPNLQPLVATSVDSGVSYVSERLTAAAENQISSSPMSRETAVLSTEDKGDQSLTINQLIEQIPVATDTIIVPMTWAEYESYTNSLGHLPVLSPSYVFGRTIPMPQTDDNGHVVVLASEELAQRTKNHSKTAKHGLISDEREQHGAAPEVPVATVNGVMWMRAQEYGDYTNNLGHLPVLSKEYVFGHSIPIPKTDKQGRISVSDKVQSLQALRVHD